MTRVGVEPSIWSLSPYRILPDDDEDGDNNNAEHEDYIKVDPNKQLPDAIPSKPPSGYFTEFSADYTPDDTYTKFNDKGSILLDENTAIGKAAKILTLDPTKSIRDKDVKMQSKHGATFMNNITKVPLSDFWHRLTQFIASLIFGTNVASSIYDLAQSPNNLHYKVPNIFFGVVANVLLFVWFKLRPNIMNYMSGGKKKDNSNKHPKMAGVVDSAMKKREEKEKKEKEKQKKYQQYAENVLHEALLYPIIVLSVFGFANDKMYNIKTDWFNMLQLILIIIDAIDVLWTQIMRITMINRFLNDIEDVLGPDIKKMGYNMLMRGIITTVANFVLFIFLILLLGMQVHTDNFNNADDAIGYRGSIHSIFLLIAVITLPLLNLVVFIAVNYHWVVELLLVLGSKNSNDQTTQAVAQIQQFGFMDDATKIVSSEAICEKLEGLRDVHPFKRLISVTTEPIVVGLIIAWEVILVLAIYSFEGCEHTILCQNGVVQVIFVVLAILANTHAVVVTLLFNFGVVVVAAALFFYPVSVPFFAWENTS